MAEWTGVGMSKLYEDQWKVADASLCKSKGHPWFIESLAGCRWLSMSGDAGPKLGHEDCEPLLTAEGIGRLLGVTQPVGSISLPKPTRERYQTRKQGRHEIVVDTESCIFGWGPCESGFSHSCQKLDGHTGRHVCSVCGATTRRVE